MKVRIKQGCHWYKNFIGRTFKIIYSNTIFYVLGDGRKIHKDDAEVVENVKSCETCGSDECNLCGEDHIKWKPIEKSCGNCRFNNINCEDATRKYCKHDNRFFYWQPKWSVEDDILDKKEPLINLMKLTTQSGFSRYVNPYHIISITEIEDGTSIATSDRDGDYLVVDSIGDVLEKLGYSE